MEEEEEDPDLKQIRELQHQIRARRFKKREPSEREKRFWENQKQTPPHQNESGKEA
jgi:P pilus assembly chaperone PapD